MVPPVSQRVSLMVAVMILIVAILLLFTAYDYRGGSGIFPRFIGWIFVGLALTECLVQLKVVFTTGPDSISKDSSGPDKTVIKEIKGVLWLCFFLSVLYLGGFLVGIPIYIFSFLRLSAGRTYKQAVLMSVGAIVFIYLLFIELLQYRLYEGLLFSQEFPHFFRHFILSLA